MMGIGVGVVSSGTKKHKKRSRKTKSAGMIVALIFFTNLKFNSGINSTANARVYLVFFKLKFNAFDYSFLFFYTYNTHKLLFHRHEIKN